MRRPTDWERAREIFGFPDPPREVVEHQFDGFDDKLRRMAATPYEQIDFGDLWYYHHDLAYIELQQDLFDYLFPVCLMDWVRTLQHNEGSSHGDSELHYGLKQGRVLERMMTLAQREMVFEFFRDALLDRIDAERGFVYNAQGTPAYGWMMRFNSLGLVMPGIERIWRPWWSLDTPGQAVAVLQYCSGLLYFPGEGPYFPQRTAKQGGGGPYLEESDSHIMDAGWLPENIEFLRTTLSPGYVEEKVRAAVHRLEGEPEYDKAVLLERALSEQLETAELRIDELIEKLAEPELIGCSEEADQEEP